MDSSAILVVSAHLVASLAVSRDAKLEAVVDVAVVEEAAVVSEVGLASVVVATTLLFGTILRRRFGRLWAGAAVLATLEEDGASLL